MVQIFETIQVHLYLGTSIHAILQERERAITKVEYKGKLQAKIQFKILQLFKERLRVEAILEERREEEDKKSWLQTKTFSKI